jgi:hypothetical protein
LSTKAASERRLAEVSFYIAARAIQLLENGMVPAIANNRMQAPVRIFLSHAKADLAPSRQDPVRFTATACDDEAFPIEKWFDSRNIATSQDFSEAITAGIRDCSIMLAFLTDQYSSRQWCRREVLEAKRMGAHILIVNALESGEPRSFPYGGNVPVIRWNYGSPSEVEARRVIDRAVLEALRFQHNRVVLERQVEAGDQVLSAPPEALTLAAEPEGEARTYLYPDPPLGREELDVLHRLRPQIHFITPLTRLAAQCKQKAVETICVGISESGDAHRYGLSDTHIGSLCDEIHLYLLLAGLKIAYGGALIGDFSKGSNFTLRLFELVRGYSKLADGVNAPPIKKAILNVAPWPLRLNYGESEDALFDGDVARYLEGPRPELPWSDNDLFPFLVGTKRTLASDTPLRRYAWARGLTSMRELISASSQARLVLGGKMESFAGLVPGVAEEAWLSLTQRKPLYLVGGFGGAARAVCDLLRGTKREEFTTVWAREHIADYDTAVGYYADAGKEFSSLEIMGLDISAYAGQDLGHVLKNGLDDRENRELMASIDAQRISGLVLTGLCRL